MRHPERTMSNTKTRAASMALLVALGCSGSDGGGTAGRSGTSGGGAAAGGNGAPTGSGGTAAGTGGTATGTAGTETGTGGVAAGTGGVAETGSGGAPAGSGGAEATTCDDGGAFSGPQLRDCNLPGACGRCLWEKACANFLFRCAHNADCVCMAECVGMAGVNATQSCLGQCGLTESPPGFPDWVRAAADMCWDEGCGTLGAPPPEAPVSTTGGSTGAGTDPDCMFDTNLSYDPCGPVLQLESADGSLCARIERRDDGPGSDANTSWTLLDVRIGPLGQVCHTDDPAALCWFSSHHNYAEWLHVSCGDLHYDLNIGHGCGKLRSPDSTFRLHVFENGPTGGDCAPTADGTCPVVAPMDLFAVP